MENFVRKPQCLFFRDFGARGDIICLGQGGPFMEGVQGSKFRKPSSFRKPIRLSTQKAGKYTFSKLTTALCGYIETPTSRIKINAERTANARARKFERFFSPRCSAFQHFDPLTWVSCSTASCPGMTRCGIKCMFSSMAFLACSAGVHAHLLREASADVRRAG